MYILHSLCLLSDQAYLITYLLSVKQTQETFHKSAQTLLLSFLFLLLTLGYDTPLSSKSHFWSPNHMISEFEKFIINKQYTSLAENSNSLIKSQMGFEPASEDMKKVVADLAKVKVHGSYLDPKILHKTKGETVYGVHSLLLYQGEKKYCYYELSMKKNKPLSQEALKIVDCEI